VEIHHQDPVLLLQIKEMVLVLPVVHHLHHPVLLLQELVQLPQAIHHSDESVVLLQEIHQAQEVVQLPQALHSIQEIVLVLLDLEEMVPLQQQIRITFKVVVRNVHSFGIRHQQFQLPNNYHKNELKSFFSVTYDFKPPNKLNVPSLYKHNI
jgi:hypothetical protein